MSERTSFSRRSLLAAAPTLALVPANTVMASADPIFAAIERHKEAYKAFYKDEDLTQEEGDEETAACEALLATVPTTKEGIRAALEWLIKFDEHCVPETSGKFLPTLLKSPALIGGAYV